MLRLQEDSNRERWRRLEEILSKLDGLSISRLSRSEVRELGELYRRAATDLAIARAESRDPKVTGYLNHLVIKAHGKIYKTEKRGGKVLTDFFVREFPKAFRRNIRVIGFAFVFFTVLSVFSFIVNYRDPAFADALGLSQIAFSAESDDRWWLSLNDANQVGSSRILTNNILVSLMAFVYGVFFGVGTLWVLFENALHIGGVLGICYRVNPGFGNELVTFMVGHGVIELSCIFIAGGAGMMLGYSFIDPGDMTRVEALKKKGLEAVKLAVGCATLLVLAGVIEGFLSPSSLPAPVKIGTGVVSGVAMYAYLFLSGRDGDSG